MTSSLAHGKKWKTLHIAHVAFTVNSICLATAFLIYTLDWIGNTTQCGQSGVIITYASVIVTVFYGLLFVSSTVLIFSYVLRQELNNKKLGLYLLMSSSAGVFLAILSSIVILISLYFRFNPECLHDEKGKVISEKRF
uniref:Transmembrane protein n=1 Tax=Heterorhabditis bacteriophora TaxID=37862 RepID=A0A1I7XTM1_HETBA